jgi:hypothetical protein
MPDLKQAQIGHSIHAHGLVMGVHTGDAHREIVLVASTIVLVQVSREGHDDSLSSQWGGG